MQISGVHICSFLHPAAIASNTLIRGICSSASAFVDVLGEVIGKILHDRIKGARAMLRDILDCRFGSTYRDPGQRGDLEKMARMDLIDPAMAVVPDTHTQPHLLAVDFLAVEARLRGEHVPCGTHSRFQEDAEVFGMAVMPGPPSDSYFRVGGTDKAWQQSSCGSRSKRLLSVQRRSKRSMTSAMVFSKR